jgi:hypothetical protein
MDSQGPGDIIDGFYKIERGGSWLPVAIWTRDEVRNFRIGDGQAADEFEQQQTIHKCRRAPKEDVKHAFANDMQWPADAIGYEPDTSEDATPAPEPLPAPPAAVQGRTTARAEQLGMIDAVDKWSQDVPGEIDKDLADKAANNDDRLLQLESAVNAERDNAMVEPKIVDWKSILDRNGPARDACKAVYVTWQRARDVAGHGGKAKEYLRKHDAEHPENIAAARAAAEAAQRAQLERDLEAKRQAALKIKQEAAAEKARLAKRAKLEQDRATTNQVMGADAGYHSATHWVPLPAPPIEHQ